MRLTKDSVSQYQRKQLKRVNDAFNRTGTKDISVYMPGATAGDIEFFNRHFKSVKQGLMGYVEFKR